VVGWLMDRETIRKNNAEIGKSVLTYPMTVCICQAATNKKIEVHRPSNPGLRGYLGRVSPQSRLAVCGASSSFQRSGTHGKHPRAERIKQRLQRLNVIAEATVQREEHGMVANTQRLQMTRTSSCKAAWFPGFA
jgi:hypothetical protein